MSARKIAHVGILLLGVYLVVEACARGVSLFAGPLVIQQGADPSGWTWSPYSSCHRWPHWDCPLRTYPWWTSHWQEPGLVREVVPRHGAIWRATGAHPVLDWFTAAWNQLQHLGARWHRWWHRLRRGSLRVGLRVRLAHARGGYRLLGCRHRTVQVQPSTRK